MHGWYMGWGGLWVVLFWLAVIVLGVWAFRWALIERRPEERRQQEPKQQEATPREIAERRYARGELSREEFLTLVNDLESRGNLPDKAKRS